MTQKEPFIPSPALLHERMSGWSESSCPLTLLHLLCVQTKQLSMHSPACALCADKAIGQTHNPRLRTLCAQIKQWDKVEAAAIGASQRRKRGNTALGVVEKSSQQQVGENTSGSLRCAKQGALLHCTTLVGATSLAHVRCLDLRMTLFTWLPLDAACAQRSMMEDFLSARKKGDMPDLA